MAAMPPSSHQGNRRAMPRVHDQAEKRSFRRPRCVRAHDVGAHCTHIGIWTRAVVNSIFSLNDLQPIDVWHTPTHYAQCARQRIPAP
jgi:hypothetical protein